MLDHRIEHPDAAPIADHERVHHQLEKPALGHRPLDLAAENREHIIGCRPGPGRGVAVEEQIHRIVADPLDRHLDHARRHPLDQQFIGVFIRHQRAVIRQPQFLHERDRVRRQVPVRRAKPPHRPPQNPRQHILRTHHQPALGRLVEMAVVLMDPAMQPDLMPAAGNPPRLVGVEQRRHRRHEKARRHPLPSQMLENPRHPHPAPELAPGQPADRLAAPAKLETFMVTIERQRHRRLRSIRPMRRLQRSPGAHTLDPASPFGFGLQVGGFHGSVLEPRVFGRDTFVRISQFAYHKGSTQCWT